MIDLKLILPKQLDNHFRGNKLALWFFYVLTAITLWRSQHHLLAEDGGAQSIATIPLDMYSSGASSTIIGLFALWGLSQLILGGLYVLAAWRYKSMIPILYLLGVFEYAVRAFYVGGWKPVETAGEAPGAIANIPLMIVFAVMLLLSLWRGGSPSTKCGKLKM